jgi:ASC-1-like (ASCH) protein
MLLFVRNPYYQAIAEGRKRFELRAGPRYRNLVPGSHISINGRFRKTIKRVERFTRPEEASRASRKAGYFLSVAAIRACYPDANDLVMLFF